MQREERPGFNAETVPKEDNTKRETENLPEVPFLL
jgi:hypothetical protein